MWDGFNLRKFPRLPLRCRLTVYPGRSISKYSTTTKNLSLGGVCCILSKPFARMKVCKVKVKLQSNSKPIEGVGRISWSVPTQQSARGKKVYDVGIEFIDFPPEGIERIRRFLVKK